MCNYSATSYQRRNHSADINKSNFDLLHEIWEENMTMYYTNNCRYMNGWMDGWPRKGTLVTHEHTGNEYVDIGNPRKRTFTDQYSNDKQIVLTFVSEHKTS